MSFREFKNFVLYAPPGTSVFHYRNQGWVVGDHLAALMLGALTGTTIPRPGITDAAEQDEKSPFTNTVEQYMQFVAEAEAAEEAEREGGD